MVAFGIAGDSMSTPLIRPVKIPILGVVCAGLVATLGGISGTAHAVGVSGQGTWETTLKARDLDGNLNTAEAYYDTVKNITWLADTIHGNYQSGGYLHGWQALSWAAGLDAYGSGITGWRLPTTVQVYCGPDPYYNCSITDLNGEMASMYFTTLGNLSMFNPATGAVVAPPGWGLSNTGPFVNLAQNNYWSSTPDTDFDANVLWAFEFYRGQQYSASTSYLAYAWAVHDGDVGVPLSPVPEPGTWALCLAGLMGVVTRLRLRQQGEQRA
jgi:hypothetical protein